MTTILSPMGQSCNTCRTEFYMKVAKRLSMGAHYVGKRLAQRGQLDWLPRRASAGRVWIAVSIDEARFGWGVHLAAGIGASRNFNMLCGRREPGAQVVWDARLQTALVAPCASEGVRRDRSHPAQTPAQSRTRRPRRSSGSACTIRWPHPTTWLESPPSRPTAPPTR